MNWLERYMLIVLAATCLFVVAQTPKAEPMSSELPLGLSTLVQQMFEQMTDAYAQASAAESQVRALEKELRMLRAKLACI